MGENGPLAALWGAGIRWDATLGCRWRCGQVTTVAGTRFRMNKRTFALLGAGGDVDRSLEAGWVHEPSLALWIPMATGT